MNIKLKRLAATILDGLIISLLKSIVFFLWYILFKDQENMVLNITMFFSSFVLIFFFLKRFHSTPGKALLNLHVYNLENTELTNSEIFKRQIGYIVIIITFGIVLIPWLINVQKTPWHDRFSGTFVK